ARHFDSAGLTINARLDGTGDPIESFDFKGNLLRMTCRLAGDYAAIPDWLAAPRLENESFEGAVSYDALNRPTQSIAPHSSLAGATFHVTQPAFNAANLLERVDVWLGRGAAPAALLNRAVDAPSPV